MEKINEDKGITLLFLCKCSTNISNNLDFKAIKAWVRKRKDVNLIITGNLLCSPKEKQDISLLIKGTNNYIKSRKIASIVVAACSPKLHEKTFRDLAEAQGINMFKIHMANIREQCAWVTKDKEEATQKAIRLINAAIQRSRYAEDLKKITMKALTDVVIIGGGISGINTALTLSRAGRKVYLIDKEISIGGAVIKTEEVAPNMECSPCLLSPLLSKIRDDPDIQVISNNILENYLKKIGFWHDGRHQY